MRYLVTIKLPKNPNHNPHDKKTGPCPVFGGTCTDMTGEHHTGLVETYETLAEVHDTWRLRFHVTRIEIVP